MTTSLETISENLKELSDSELQMKYYHYVDLIDLLDQKKLCFGDEGEFNIRTNFRNIKRECESRFHVTEFPMSK